MYSDLNNLRVSADEFRSAAIRLPREIYRAEVVNSRWTFNNDHEEYINGLINGCPTKPHILRAEEDENDELKIWLVIDSSGRAFAVGTHESKSEGEYYFRSFVDAVLVDDINQLTL